MENKQDSKTQMESIRTLFNDLLYVLTNSYYMGKHAHMVATSKQFVIDLINDFERNAKAVVEAEAKAKVEADTKPESVKA